MQRKAIIIGATGMVGERLVKQLASLYETVIVLARRSPQVMNEHMQFYQVNDFANIAEVVSGLSIGSDTDAFSCLGTTKKQAGSEEAFRQVDFEMNFNFAQSCRDKAVPQFFLLSALGADVHSRFFYNRVKGELEAAIEQLGFAQFVIFRPSLLLGERKGRFLETASQKVFKLVSPLLSESLSAHPISVQRVAAAMAMTAHALYERQKFVQDTQQSQTTIIENKQMLAMTRLKS
ncbi:NAD-dependent epimerase/dehydratase family protein [Psychrobacter sp. I-STPA6b]|uniref:NAD-dependent epimerase/dehydratase family protein n=1 Tax=Psychrobacter sp. I-STPA6b TaxID=2585718 RepID=UPI001D0C3D33|nr:NAD-dependent epimerase/dehydratase family protein [Psychrobacter sp. I-STPA6b]